MERSTERSFHRVPLMSLGGARFGARPLLLLGALLGALAVGGCGNGHTSTAAQSSQSSTNVQSNQQNSSSSSQSTQQSSGGSSNSTQQNSQSTNSSGSGNLSQSSFSSNGSTLRTFAGSKAATITVSVDQPSRLVWSNESGKTFKLSGSGLSVDSTSGLGQEQLSTGTHTLRVSGDLWTVAIRPR